MIDHPYQLRRIELQDFKSVAQASVELGPLTCVVGANSSGKSTLLQSILAVTQAVRSGIGTAEFPLNGEFVRLGTFEETRNFLAVRANAPMSIAFELVDTAGRVVDRSIEPDDADDSPLMKLVWRAYLEGSADGITAGGFARLDGLEIEIRSVWPGGDEEGTRVLSCDVSSLQAGPGALVDLPRPEGRLATSLPSERAIASSGRIQDWDSGASSAIDAVTLSGGVPQALLTRVGAFDHLAEEWWNVVHDVLDTDIRERKRGVAKSKSSKADDAAVLAAKADIELLRDRDVDGGGVERFVMSHVAVASGDLKLLVYRRLGQLQSKEREDLISSVVHLGEVQFRSRLRQELRHETWIDDELLVEQAGAAGEVLQRSALVSQRFFRSSVRYLGPLREAPHVLYDPGPSKLDLGVRGEYSAAVLHAQANAHVLMPTPDGAGSETRLSEALDFWLREFGLAERARSEDRGRIGIGLSVTPRGIDREVDLTSVGVGVSQILPVILLCLLAEPGTLLVLEQPELHLHPKLQQDLADFLLACARSGRQLVIETHSEHLVNRLRYRIAQDETSGTHELIQLVFAENHDGVTSYREPEINQFGGLGDDWPDGFLDLTAKEAQQFVMKSLEKRRREQAT